MKRLEYKNLSQAPFDITDERTGGAEFKMLVYTGKTDENAHPIFKTVLATCPAKANIGSKDYYGIVGMDIDTCELQWHNYNDCVSLEDWKVLDRLIDNRFSWMKSVDPLIAIEVKIMAKAQLNDHES